MNSEEEVQPSGDPGQALVGTFCHTFGADGSFRRQGRIHAYLGNQHYLVYLYSAFDGEQTYGQIATLHDMRVGGWRFYPNGQIWKDAGDDLMRDLARDDYTPPGAPPILGIS